MPGAIYHVMSRGDRRDDIFLDDVDRHDFLKTLAETCEKTGFQVHAYCLMRNHFHLVVETPGANLVAGMAWLLSTYTIRLNHRHELSGHLFSGRYKALLVEGDGDGYLRTVCDYVHFNPVRARLRRRAGCWPTRGAVWAVLGGPGHRPNWMRVDRLLGEHGIGRDSAAGRREFERRMEARRAEATDNGPCNHCAGAGVWAAKPSGRRCWSGWKTGAGNTTPGALRQESAEVKAGRIIAEELRRLGWQESELAERRKTDPGKLALAARLRRETTLPLKWIAARVRLGTSKSANKNLHQWMQAARNPPSSRQMQRPQKHMKAKNEPYYGLSLFIPLLHTFTFASLQHCHRG